MLAGRCSSACEAAQSVRTALGQPECARAGQAAGPDRAERFNYDCEDECKPGPMNRGRGGTTNQREGVNGPEDSGGGPDGREGAAGVEGNAALVLGLLPLRGGCEVAKAEGIQLKVPFRRTRLDTPLQIRRSTFSWRVLMTSSVSKDGVDTSSAPFLAIALICTPWAKTNAQKPQRQVAFRATRWAFSDGAHPHGGAANLRGSSGAERRGRADAGAAHGGAGRERNTEGSNSGRHRSGLCGGVWTFGVRCFAPFASGCHIRP